MAAISSLGLGSPARARKTTGQSGTKVNYGIFQLNKIASISHMKRKSASCNMMSIFAGRSQPQVHSSRNVDTPEALIVPESEELSDSSDEPGNSAKKKPSKL